MKDPFSLHTPSVFVVSSPFQALCAVAAIRNLHIIDYKLIAVLANNVRDRQMINYLISSNIKYSKFIPNNLRGIRQIIKIVIGINGKYERLFIGDLNSNYRHYIGYTYIRCGADLIYIDDGTATLSFLCGAQPKREYCIKRLISKILAKRKNVELRKSFYTIYGDIKNNHFNITMNDISILFNGCNYIESKKNILIIGTDISQYCNQLQIDYGDFVSVLRDVFDGIRNKYPNEQIVYIPHGSDVSEYALKICKEYDADFHFLETMVELYYLSLPYLPVNIYGFGSTALLNIKRIAPQQNVVNLFVYKSINCPLFAKYKTISDYYKENGIPCIKIEV